MNRAFMSYHSKAEGAHTAVHVSAFVRRPETWSGIAPVSINSSVLLDSEKTTDLRESGGMYELGSGVETRPLRHDAVISYFAESPLPLRV
jgi:hypothetical protein